jgi:hypothetical protein
MTNQGHSDPEKGSKDQYKRHIDGNITVRGELEVHQPPDAIEADNTERKDQKSNRNRTFLVSWLTLVAVVIYAGITFWQGCSAKKSADAAKDAANTAHDALVLVNRPWVGPMQGASLDVYRETSSSGYYLLKIPIKNSGPSPALHVSHHVYPMRFGATANITETVKEISQTCDLAEMMAAKPKWPGLSKADWFGTTMFPNQPYTIFEKYLWGDGHPENDDPFLLVGCVAYTDEFDPAKIHHTALCFRSYDKLRDILPLPKPKVAQDLTVCNFGSWAD